MITFQLQEREFLEGSATVALWPKKRLLLTVATFGIVLAAGSYFAFSPGYSVDVASAGQSVIAIALGGSIATAVLRPLVFRWKFRRNFRRLAASRPSTTISWNREGLTAELDSKKYFSSWSEFVKWKQTSQLILLYKVSGRGIAVVMIPKRAFTNCSQLDELVRLVADSIDSKQLA